MPLDQISTLTSRGSPVHEKPPPHPWICYWLATLLAALLLTTSTAQSDQDLPTNEIVTLEEDWLGSWELILQPDTKPTLVRRFSDRDEAVILEATLHNYDAPKTFLLDLARNSLAICQTHPHPAFPEIYDLVDSPNNGIYLLLDPIEGTLLHRITWMDESTAAILYRGVIQSLRELLQQGVIWGHLHVDNAIVTPEGTIIWRDPIAFRDLATSGSGPYTQLRACSDYLCDLCGFLSRLTARSPLRNSVQKLVTSERLRLEQHPFYEQPWRDDAIELLLLPVLCQLEEGLYNPGL